MTGPPGLSRSSRRTPRGTQAPASLHRDLARRHENQIVSPAPTMGHAWGVRFVGLLLILLLSATANEALAQRAHSGSRCLGTPSKGRLENGVQLPARGANYRTYGQVPWRLGRTYVHEDVRAAVLEAYAALETSQVGHVFVYGETGFFEGGPFEPHRTHQNGLSVDFMVPVRKGAAPAQLPTTPGNRFGYGVHFDRLGRSGGLAIDFEAVAAHLAELRRAAEQRGMRIEKVIFAPELRRRLRGTTRWGEIRDLPFTKKRVWVRHDEHYHVDFATSCAPLT